MKRSLLTASLIMAAVNNPLLNNIASFRYLAPNAAPRSSCKRGKFKKRSKGKK